MRLSSLFDIDVFIVKVAVGTSEISGAGLSVAGAPLGSKRIPAMTETVQAELESSFLSVSVAGTAAIFKPEKVEFSSLF